jgi:hypothetical protein
MKLETNVGKNDAMIRMGVGALLLLLAIAGVVGTWGFVIGAVLAATGYFKKCPGYSVMKMNTCEKG